MGKRIFATAGMLLGMVVGATTVQADSYSDAFAAAERGHYDQALSLFTPLAEQGNAQAQFNLALMYHGGLGVKRNEQQAVAWYQRAASNGSKEAQEFLAVGYQEGWFGLPRDTQQANYWFERLKDS